MQEMTESVQ